MLRLLPYLSCSLSPRTTRPPPAVTNASSASSSASVSTGEPLPVVASHLGSLGWARTTTSASVQRGRVERALGVGVDRDASRPEGVSRARVGHVGGMRRLHPRRELRADRPRLGVGLVEEHADDWSRRGHPSRLRSSPTTLNPVIVRLMSDLLRVDDVDRSDSCVPGRGWPLDLRRRRQARRAVGPRGQAARRPPARARRPARLHRARRSRRARRHDRGADRALLRARHRPRRGPRVAASAARGRRGVVGHRRRRLHRPRPRHRPARISSA